MAQVVISDFKYGLDRRRPRVAGIPGTCWNLINAHVSRGGDIERAKKFVATYTLPTNTFGMGQVDGQLYVWGSADLLALMPVGVQYQRLDIASSAAMVRVLHNNAWDGKHYVIAEYADGSIHHFYDGVRVGDLDALSDTNSTVNSLADYLARKIDVNAAVEAISFGATILLTAVVPGIAFTISASSVNLGATADNAATVSAVRANVAAVAETRASGTVTITGGSRLAGTNYVSQITVNSVNLMDEAVDWLTSHAVTANAVANKINNLSSIHGYIASVVGAVITMAPAVGTGVTPNGYVVTSTLAGDVTTTDVNMTGGVAAATAVAQVSKVVLGGTYEPLDQFTIVINGTAYVATGRASGQGAFAFTHKAREWLTANSLLRYSQLNDPDDFTDADTSSGAGFISVINDSEGSARLVAITPYQTAVAVFARGSIRIYALSTDAEENAFRQSIDNAGTIAARSVIPFGNTDVFYLDEPGIRSLRVREGTSDSPVVADAGSAIDPLVADWMLDLSEDAIERAVSAIEPVDGRFWLALGSRIYVLSYFPSVKINAWSFYEPGFTVTDFARANRKIYARDTDTIYLYGGADGETYPGDDEQPITVELPFTSAGTPATFKHWTAFDIACEGVWRITLQTDPRNDAKEVDIGRVTGTTFNLPGIASVGEEPMLAPKLICNVGGYASISNVIMHFDSPRKRREESV